MGTSTSTSAEATAGPPSTREATARRLDAAKLRTHFPALDQTVNGHPLVYLDNAATSQKPTAVLDAISSYYERDNANVHRGIHELSRRATVAYEEARGKVARWIGASDASEIVWTRGTTDAINLVAGAWGLDNVGEGDEILLTVLEHHSNIVPWQLLAARRGATLRYLELDEQGRLVLDDLPRLLNDRTRLVAVSHVSNALGTINPLPEIISAAHDHGALVLVDGAQGAVHAAVDVQRMGADFYAFSGHKMCGPTGIGVLWARRELLQEMAPYQGGGEMIGVVGRDSSTWADVPHKFEAGTPNIVGAIGLGAAVDFLAEVGMSAIEAHERELLIYALDRIRDVPGVRVFGPEDHRERSAVVSFTLGDAHPHDISTILDMQGIAVRAGHHCAQLVMKHFGVAATARASLYLYNTKDDVDRLIEGLHQVRSVFG
jgi:cysteine desulfurase/selenocysteine lyase